MKKKILIAVGIAGLVALGTVVVRGDFLGIGRAFKKVKKWTEGAVKTVGRGIKTAVKETGKFGKKVGKGITKVAKKVKECIEAAALGTALGVERAAYKVAKAGLEIGKVSIEIAKQGVNAAKGSVVAADNVQKGLLIAAEKAQEGVVRAANAVQIAATETAQVSIKLPGLTVEALAALLSKTVNIEKCYLKSQLKDWPAGKLPKFRMEGVFFGKNFKFDVQADFKDISQLFVDLFNEIF